MKKKIYTCMLLRKLESNQQIMFFHKQEMLEQGVLLVM